MNIPEGYRRLADGEITKAGDRVLTDSGTDELCEFFPGLVVGRGVSQSFWIIRKIESGPWIAMSERRPEWAVTVVFSDDPFVVSGSEWHAWVGFWSYENRATNAGNRTPTHWMPLANAPKPPATKIAIQEGVSTREVIFNEDGSLQVGCVSIDSEKFESIVARREEVTGWRF